MLIGYKVHAEPASIPVPSVNISVNGTDTPKEYVDNIKLLILLTILTLLPSIIIMMTSFIRIIVVFSFLRSAIGTQQAPPNQVLTGLAIFLTIFIMTPTFNEINTKAFKPYLEGTITQQQAFDEGSKPLRQFMLKSTRQNDLKLFIELSKLEGDVTKDNVPLYVVVPAFVISELRTAFNIGFMLYIPFLIIDLVVASVLLSMGMMMLPPVMVSLPFKLLLFVMVDGWHLLVKSLIMSFS
ncbi:flagellar type III secretion system pore protein FliP [Clostridium sp. SYSU_GA19001]|uniref:flagellar type III secretion system pore protein FliP n=1 Tax=Clostridium caldaquaticum TaxID=2940653 RepID=UPI0020774577|nr:flagellar type III secretion system pore protein FliP [Clostridium caldaquaticum]MCM8710981.1 flagellar type III secretion system pore protein FliP [Clostridium caldaquaticum]